MVIIQMHYKLSIHILMCSYINILYKYYYIYIDSNFYLVVNGIRHIGK